MSLPTTAISCAEASGQRLGRAQPALISATVTVLLRNLNSKLFNSCALKEYVSRNGNIYSGIYNFLKISGGAPLVHGDALNTYSMPLMFNISRQIELMFQLQKNRTAQFIQLGSRDSSVSIVNNRESTNSRGG
jgi:hypothetical protein